MATLKQERLQIRAELQHRRKEVLPELRAALDRAKKQRKERIRACKAECKLKKKQARERAKVATKKLREHIRRMQAAAKKVCGTCDATRAADLDKIHDLAGKIKEEQEYISRLRVRGKALRSSRGRAGGRRAAELRAECDDAVRRDLGDDRDLLELWEQNKSKIMPTAHMSRTEAFFQWIHDHPEKLDELRHRQELRYEQELADAFKTRTPTACEDELDSARLKIVRLEKALKVAREIPF